MEEWLWNSETLLFFLFPNTSIYFKPWVEIGICHYVKKKKKIFFFFPADSYPLCHQSGRKNGNGMPEKPASCEGNGSRSAAFGWSWEIFSLGMLNIKPSLQMESMEYSGFQQSLSKREFGNVLWSVYLMVIFSEYDGKPNPREPLEFWGLASPRCPHVLQIIFADFCPVTLWWPRAVLRRQNCDSLFSLGPIYWDILEITRQCLCFMGCSSRRWFGAFLQQMTLFFQRSVNLFNQTQWAVPSGQCGSLCPNFGIPCRNLDEIYALQKSLKTVALFIFILLQGQHFSNQEMTQRSPGLYKYRIFLFFWLIDTVQFLTT